MSNHKREEERKFQTVRRNANHIYFNDDITKESIALLKEHITEALLDIERIETLYSLSYGPSLLLHITSDGGDVMSGLSMYSFIRQIKPNVVTYAEGMVASAATLLFLAGDTRIMLQQSFLLFHQISSWFGGTEKVLKDHSYNIDLIRDEVHKVYMRHSSLTKKQVAALTSDEMLTDAETAHEMKFIDVMI